MMSLMGMILSTSPTDWPAIKGPVATRRTPGLLRLPAGAAAPS
jgi:hypothetical protein